MYNPDMNSGDKYNRLTAISFHHKVRYDQYWLFKCDCGAEKVIRTSHVRSGATKSCGCFNTESRSKRKKHGMNGTRPWRIWRNLINRCDNPNMTQYEDWGGRGISYDPKWKDFSAFWEDMKDGYSDNLSIDRIDNNKNYCKENCKWSTRKEQNNNQRTNRLIAVNGETKTMTEWGELLCIKPGTIWNRIENLGWSPEDAVTIPVRGSRRREREGKTFQRGKVENIEE